MNRARRYTLVEECSDTDCELAAATRIHMNTHPQTPPTARVVVGVWQGVGLILAVSVLTKGVQPLNDLVFSYFGVVWSLVLGFVLAAGVAVIFIFIGYVSSPENYRNTSFWEHLHLLASQDRIDLAQIQSNSTVLKDDYTVSRQSYTNFSSPPPPILSPTSKAPRPDII